MKYFFDFWDNLREELSNKFILLFFDYDGTLTPIVETPDKAKIPPLTREMLQILAKKNNCRVFVVSGRGLNDVKSKVGTKGIVYAGNHGFEIEGPHIKFKNPILKNTESVINKIKNELEQGIKGVKGAFIEDKGATLSLHYRLVDESRVPFVSEIFNRITKTYISNKKIRVTSGKKVFEVRPPVKWDKGKVVLWFLARQQFKLEGKKLCVFYLGDDVTDEDAFKVLKDKGISIFVGKPKASYAKYYLKDTKEVEQFMKKIIGLLN